MNILQEIVEYKKEEIQKQKKIISIESLQEQIKKQPARRSFKQAIRGKKKISVIAEVKKASPSRGVLREDFDPAAIAKEYTALGAAALSVLTEEKYFQGKIDYLKLISAAVPIPLLCKDFIFDRWQIYQACAAGASAVLLIAEILSLNELRELLHLTRELKMDALVEVHDEKQLGVVLHTRAELIGINNRDLKNFTIDLKTTEKLLPLIPDAKIVVSESGILAKKDIPKGVDAVLVGEGIIKNKEIFT